MSDIPITRLRKIMVALRDPQSGCPWDSKQTSASIAPYTIEEAYEVVDAIQRGDMDALKDELGDLLLQIVFHACMAEENGAFDFDDVATGIADKMLRRHPHVFGGAKNGENWEDIKAAERAEKNKGESLMDDIPLPLPGLTRAVKMQKRAARVGFDWDTPTAIFSKLREELDEFETEFDAQDKARMLDELGDILFVLVNLARHLKIDPETAIRSTNTKFERRFRRMEKTADVSALTPAELETLWQAAKAETD